MATESQQITQMLAGRYGTANYGNLQVVKWQYYDYVRSTPSTGVIPQKLTFFSIPQGSTDPNSQIAKTEEETNLDRNGQFTYDYVITAIRTHIQILPKSRQNSVGTLNTNAGTPNLNVGGEDGSLGQPTGTHTFLEKLSGLGSLIVNFGQKRYFEINQPFKTCPIGAGVSVRSYGGGTSAAPAAGVTTQRSYFYHQSQDPRDLYRTTPPLFVERDSIIDASIQFTDGYTTADFTLPNVKAATAGSFAFVNVGLIFDGFAIIPTQ